MELIEEPSLQRKIPNGYKLTPLGIIPENWNVFEIEDLVRLGIIDKPLDGNHGNIHPKSTDFVSSGIPFIMANDLRNSKLDLENCHFISKHQADSLQKGFAINGDVLLTHKGTVGNVAIVKSIQTDYIMLTPQVTYYRVKNCCELNNQYIKQYFQSSYFQKVLTNLSGGGTRAYLGILGQRKLPFVFPPLTEQTAIATALSDADALISSLEKLIAKKKLIKQGAMQELLRPKEGWEMKTLKDVVDIKKGQLITESTRIEGNIPVIAGGKTPAYYHNKSNRKGKTITISGSGASAGYVGFHDSPIFASDCSTISEAETYSIEYIYYYLLLIQEKISLVSGKNRFV